MSAFTNYIKLLKCYIIIHVTYVTIYTCTYIYNCMFTMCNCYYAVMLRKSGSWGELEKQFVEKFCPKHLTSRKIKPVMFLQLHHVLLRDLNINTIGIHLINFSSPTEGILLEMLDSNNYSPPTPYTLILSNHAHGAILLLSRVIYIAGSLPETPPLSSETLFAWRYVISI